MKNPYAASLKNKLFKKQVIKSKKIYSRKKIKSDKLKTNSKIKFFYCKKRNSLQFIGFTQSGEMVTRWPHKSKILGSIPRIGTKNKMLEQPSGRRHRFCNPAEFSLVSSNLTSSTINYLEVFNKILIFQQEDDAVLYGVGLQ